jgi:hypothetical protein
MIIILITIFICLGYIFILYSILTQQPSLHKIYITDKNLRSNDQSSSAAAAAASSSLLIQQQANLIHNLTLQIEQLKLETTTSYNQHPLLSMDIATIAISNTTATPYRPGLIVLGMHRSGTSIVGGLLNKMGLHTGKHIRILYIYNTTTYTIASTTTTTITTITTT